jgi:hypothetical protein
VVLTLKPKEMKKIIVVLVVLISTLSIGQNEVFKFDQTIPGVKKEKLAIISGTYIVINTNGTPDELYQKTLDWVANTWIDVEDVILTSPNNSFIKIQGTTKGILTARSAMRQGTTAKYRLTFKFKENKIKMEVTSLEAFIQPSKYNRAGWDNRNEIPIINKKGNPYKYGVKEVSLFETYLNSLATDFKNYSEEDSEEGW